MITIVAAPPFQISPAVKAVADRLCLNLQDMLRRAAICTLPEGNRRFHDWVFDVREHRVLAITNIAERGEAAHTAAKGPSQPPRKVSTQRVAMHGTKLAGDEFVMWEEHELCEGKGCLACDAGQIQVVRRMRPNPR